LHVHRTGGMRRFLGRHTAFRGHRPRNAPDRPGKRKGAGEMLSQRLLVQHNLWFYNNLMVEIRKALDEDRFDEFRAQYSERLAKRI
ncbi:MAG: hypothetical protein IJ973_06830, partial [Christensenellaceae bacterium]|nr:hypothetical protein [Christensenellaceae bacterium]